MAARHLCLSLALLLWSASATKRPRSVGSGESRQDQSESVVTIPVLRPAPAGADPVTEGTGLYFLKRAVQTAGCLFNDAVACSGGFDDPMGHAVILLSNVAVRKHPTYKPVESLRDDVGSVEQLRDELIRQKRIIQRLNIAKISQAGADQLQALAAKKLIDFTLKASDGDSSKHVRATIVSWDKKMASSELILPAVNEVFMAAEKSTARFDRSVFVWPLGRTSHDPLYPEEQLYAAAVVIMCRRLGVRPVSVFLFTKKFDNSLPPDRPNWRRPTIQVIAMATDQFVYGLEIAESCRSLVDKLGISEPLEAVTNVPQHRHKRQVMYRAKPKSLDTPAKLPMPPIPAASPLPTELQGTFTKADRLLLVRSIQLAFLLLNQTAVDQRSLGCLFLQASTIITHLLRTSGRGVPSEVPLHKPRLDVTPLDLLRVIAEADRKPDLSAVVTVGDVMIAAAQMIFRHLYLTLPVPVLAMVETFRVVGSPDWCFIGANKLKNALFLYDAPYVLGDSSTLTELYEATDAILWAAFRVVSMQRGSSSEAFVLCTREMSERVSVERQHLDYLIPAVLQKVFDSSMRSFEALVLDLLAQIAPMSQDSSSLQVPRTMSWAPVATPRGASVSDQTVAMENRIAMMADRAAIMAKRAADRASQIVCKDPRSGIDQIISKTLIVMTALFPNNMLIRGLSDIPSMVLPFLRTDLARAGELTSANRLVMTLQLQKLDVKLKRKNIPFSDTDHVTILLDALLALHVLQKGAVFQLASFPRTCISDIGTADKDSLACVLVSALFDFTLVEPAEEGSMSTAFSELTKRLTNAVEATTFN